jgi:hypothetical protein
MRSEAEYRFIFSDTLSNKYITSRNISFVAFKRAKTATWRPDCVAPPVRFVVVPRATTGSGFVGYSVFWAEDASHEEQDAAASYNMLVTTSGHVSLAVSCTSLALMLARVRCNTVHPQDISLPRDVHNFSLHNRIYSKYKFRVTKRIEGLEVTPTHSRPWLCMEDECSASRFSQFTFEEIIAGKHYVSDYIRYRQNGDGRRESNP